MAEPSGNYDDADDPYRAIRVGDPGSAGEATKWGHLLTRFMRVLALFWLLQGLAQWYVVLTARAPIFDTMPTSAALAIIFFSVLDLVAGVGLWLATPWGGVLWLLIASAQIFVAASLPRFFAGGYWLIGVDLLLIALYFALTFEAGRDFEAQKLMEQFRRRKSSPRAQPSPFSRLGRFFPRSAENKSEGSKKGAGAKSSVTKGPPPDGSTPLSPTNSLAKPAGKSVETPGLAPRKSPEHKPEG
ncbi:MAG: DUF6163 family protein [Methylocystis sp.]